MGCEYKLILAGQTKSGIYVPKEYAEKHVGNASVTAWSSASIIFFKVVK